ncbi:hypothetical protein ACFSL6_06615 [Paenibacillus thailandensis]|uniref:Transcription elongation factor GreA/GreB C-terminal domain-containing protein n=1 Tax=Paenibacillus thailandensis TaxID=393250 RepID=A0ABW5QTW4_9BACL
MEEKVRKYYKLKAKLKEMEQELGELRQEILDYYAEQERLQGPVPSLKLGSYQVKAIVQERKEYDDGKLYQSLPDPSMWRLVSKADGAKVAGLIKLNVLNDEAVKETYTVKKITLLQVDKI